MTRIRFATLALALAALPCAATAEQASTVRIEPRPFYGATVTLEEGVRVYRPLPAHKTVIINPGNRTPLSLGLYDERTYNTNYNYNSAQTGAGAGAAESASPMGSLATTAGIITIITVWAAARPEAAKACEA